LNRRSIVRLSLLAAVAAGAALCWLSFGRGVDPSSIESAMHEWGPLAPAAFVGVFALGTVLFVPGSIFGLAGGVLFGPLWGTVWNLAGATLGAGAAFVFARYIAGDWVAAKAAGRLKTVISGVEAEGWRFVALTRLVPVVPFNVLNYALGLTRIPLSHYVLATVACMLPGTAAYSWLGYAGRAALEGDGAALRYGAFGLAALALIAFLPGLVRRLKRQPIRFVSVEELKQTLACERRPLVIDVREADEFRGPLGHIPGALNIPLGELPVRCNQLKNSEQGAVILVCRTDRRSSKAAELLRIRAPAEVTVLRGGMEAWRTAMPA
jgi:uncharacterized membrane protein YdjX (TVP38/TMEM64 family)/rhodanese-related sulfurtransferase